MPKKQMPQRPSFYIKRAYIVFLTVLHDKEGFEPEDMRRVWGEILDLSRSLTEGRCSYDDLNRVLKQECGVEVTG